MKPVTANEVSVIDAELRKFEETYGLPRYNETESEADRKFIESLDKIREANRLLPRVKHRGLLIGMLAGAIFWGVLGLIVWMVR